VSLAEGSQGTYPELFSLQSGYFYVPVRNCDENTCVCELGVWSEIKVQFFAKRNVSSAVQSQKGLVFHQRLNAGKIPAMDVETFLRSIMTAIIGSIAARCNCQNLHTWDMLQNPILWIWSSVAPIRLKSGSLHSAKAGSYAGIYRSNHGCSRHEHHEVNVVILFSNLDPSQCHLDSFRSRRLGKHVFGIIEVAATLHIVS